MSKKDYELIAATIRESYIVAANVAARSESEADEAAVETLADIARSLAGALRSTNPRFDRDRFIAACMGEDSTDSAGRTVRYSAAR